MLYSNLKLFLVEQFCKSVVDENDDWIRKLGWQLAFYDLHQNNQSQSHALR